METQHTSASWHTRAVMRRGWATGHRPRRKLPQVPPEQAVAESREYTC